MPFGAFAEGRFRALILAGSLACLGNSDVAQEQLDKAFAIARDALSDGRYLEAADELQPLAIDQDGHVLDLRACRLWNQVRVDITGETRSCLETSEQDDPTSIAQLSDAKPQAALPTIVRLARRTRIVILNEDHESPRQRAFALKVAQALRPLGYDILALEALYNDGDSAERMLELKRRGYVVLSDGFYTREPVFGDFIRQALRLGYSPASYEHAATHEGSGIAQIEAREQGQAENLLTIIEQHPKSKLLVYVGQSHVAEAPLENGQGKIVWMAARLRKLSAIDPLTLDQTTLDSGCRICAHLAGHREQPLVFFGGSKPVVTGQFRGAVDLQVYKPETGLVAGRPAWLLSMGRRPVPVPDSILPKHGRRLLQAFAASESNDAVPMDQFVVTAGQRAPEFMLAHVKVRFSFQQASY